MDCQSGHLAIAEGFARTALGKLTGDQGEGERNRCSPPSPIVPVRQFAKDKVHDLRNGARIGCFQIETTQTDESIRPN